MSETHAAFDLMLAYPQWQGSGRNENLPRGARAAAEVCAAYGPLAEVPLSTREGDGEGVRRWEAILDQFRSAQALLAQHRPRRLLTAGGDCAVDVATIDWLAGVHPGLTVIWIDAHLDANTPETSPSGSFHGMPVSAILGDAPAPMRTLMGRPLDPSRFRYAGIRVGDAGDWAFRDAHGLTTLDPEAPVAGPVHVHFDLDVLDPAEFPHLAYREPGGLSIDAAEALVARIAREGDIMGFTVTEFAPADDEDAREGSKVIRRLLDAAVRK